MINFCKYCLLLSLCCSFASLCARSWSPSQTACGSTPVLFSPPSPVFENDCLQKIAIFGMSCAICYFLSAFHALQRLFYQTFVNFCKICSPPSVGSTFLKDTCKQSGLINVSFGSLLGAFSPLIPFRRALFRQ